MSRNVDATNYRVREPDGVTMAGLEVPTWDPETAMLIGTILLEAVVLYAAYGGLERVVGPSLMTVLVGGETDAR